MTWKQKNNTAFELCCSVVYIQKLYKYSVRYFVRMKLNYSLLLESVELLRILCGDINYNELLQCTFSRVANYGKLILITVPHTLFNFALYKYKLVETRGYVFLLA